MWALEMRRPRITERFIMNRGGDLNAIAWYREAGTSLGQTCVFMLQVALLILSSSKFSWPASVTAVNNFYSCVGVHTCTCVQASSDRQGKHLRFDCHFQNPIASRVAGYAGCGIQQALPSKDRNISQLGTLVLLWFISLSIYGELCLGPFGVNMWFRHIINGGASVRPQIPFRAWKSYFSELSTSPKHNQGGQWVARGVLE